MRKASILLLIALLTTGCIGRFVRGPDHKVTAVGRDQIEDIALFSGVVVEKLELWSSAVKLHNVEVPAEPSEIPMVSLGHLIKISIIDSAAPDRWVVCLRGGKEQLDRKCRGVPLFDHVAVRAKPLSEDGYYEAVNVTPRQ